MITGNHFYEEYFSLLPDMELDCRRFLVGPNEDTFVVPVAILTSVSPVFEAMLNGPYKERSEQTIYLPHDNGDNFKQFLELVPYARNRPSYVKLDFESIFHTSLPKLVLVWKLANKYGATPVCQLLAELAAVAPTKALKPIMRENGLYYFHQLVNQTITEPPVIWSDRALEDIVSEVIWQVSPDGLESPLHGQLHEFEPSSSSRLQRLIGMKG
eukprot:Filipodium_phascolosomae@DN6053_c0_g1_i1.p1